MDCDLNDPMFRDEDKARAFLEGERWPNGAVCPFCGGTERVVALAASGALGKGWFQCSPCRKKFTVRVGTLYERSHIPLHKWLLATHLLTSSKKGISAHQLHRMLGITYKSAWFMAHRIREAMRVGGLKPPMGGDGGIVEVDETWVGRAASHPKGRQKFRGSGHRNVVLALVERGGQVRTYHVAGSTVDEVIPIVHANVAKEAAVMTDAAQLYKYRLRHRFASHDRVDHTKDEYVRYEDGRPPIHTNTVEGYFSVFKRGMRGVYQHCSEKHLHRYLAEFDFRYNARSALGVEDKERALRAIRGIEGKRLTYRRTSRTIA